MEDKKIDSIDREMIKLLSRDGRMPAKEMARKLEISAPTVQSRMASLIKRGILKIAGLVDTFKTSDTLVAILAIRVDDNGKMGEVIDQLMEFDNIHWAVAVTGRYDIFAEVIVTEGIEWMFRFYEEQMSTIDGISHAESFMVTNTRRKWTLLPPQIRGWTRETP
ncbi:MAG: Lrp/AsnC family transcriptional regulator [Desulfobacterales bacterium]|nr:Lrp/AsnC family transcriptional regulator [Desulfobacterales bacterium]